MATSAGPKFVERFFAADSVAIVGASERQHHTRALMDCLTGLGMAPERISLVSPTSQVVHGIKTAASLGELPEVPSLVFSLVPARFVAGVLTEAGQLGVSALVCIADGFADAGEEGRELQRDLVEIAGRFDIAVLGPNTLGYLAPGRGIGAWVADWSAVDVPALRPGSISIVAQSSGILNILLQLAAHRRIGVRAAVSVGNEAVTDAAQFVQAFAEDEATSVIGVVLESTTRPQALVQALIDARRNGKRVVIFKFGSSEIGRRNALSHSGRLASEGRIWDALFDKLGVGLARDFDEFVDGLSLAATFERAGYHGDGDLGFLTVSGGDVGLLGDLCESIGIPLAPLSEATRESLLAVERNTTHAASNPIDLGLIGHRLEVLDGIADCIFADEGVGFVGSRLALPWRFSEKAAAVYETLYRRASQHHKPLLVVTRGAEPLEAAWFDYFAERDIAFLTAYGSGLRTLGAVLDMYGHEGYLSGWSADAVPAVVAPSAEEEELLSWDATQQMLSEWGVPHVRSAVSSSEEELLAIGEGIGYPLCLKGLVPGVVHKSDAGLVRVGIADAEALRRARREIAEQPAATGEVSYELQQMVPITFELILGMTRDPIMGPVITLGAGGTGVEVLGDVTCALPPVTNEEVFDLLSRLRIGVELLDDRRSSATQRAQFVALVRSFAEGVIAAGPHLSQVDLNPIVFTSTGEVTAVDAVITVTNAEGAAR